jgi:hypothetical protein
MKIVLFQMGGGSITPGIIQENGIVDISSLVPASAPQKTIEWIIDNFEDLRPQIEAHVANTDTIPLSQVRLRPPIPRPSSALSCVVRPAE